MLERIWTYLLLLVSQFVTPDWGKLIGLIPVAIAVLVALVLIGTFRRLAKAPPARRGKRRITPGTPAGIHMPGPSFAPAFAAVGMFLLVLGLVFGGVTLLLGAIALVLTLLYWLAEGLRIYDHDIGNTSTAVAVVTHDGPPPGVHMPGPSWRPFLGAFGMFGLMLGLVFGGWVLLAGVITLVSTLVGWLVDAIVDYRRVVEADTTGHIDNGPPPRTPSMLLTALSAIIISAVVLQASAFTIGEANGGSAPGASGAPPPNASGAPGASGPPPSGPAADVQLQAKGIAFVEQTWSGPAAKPFTLAFDNEDPGTPHNVALKDGSGTVVWRGEVFTGVATKVYDVTAQPAGTYTFVCDVHPSMTGTATLQ